LNKLNPKKLLNSKWTAVSSDNKEKHFIITEVDYNEDGLVVSCCIEAVLSRRQSFIDWRELKDNECWLQGWV
tara:strand:+ start:2741 stop:2956 length:216 start_codon:yes stop_codon:yes gene_type:complete